MTAVQIHHHATMQPMAAVKLPDWVVTKLQAGDRLRFALYPDPTPYSYDPGPPGPLKVTLQVAELWLERVVARGERFFIVCTDLKVDQAHRLERLFPLPDPTSPTERRAGS